MTTHMEKQKLPVEFPHSVREEKNKQHVELQLQLEKKLETKKNAVAEMNASIKLDREAISKLAHELKEGTHLVDVDVEMKLDMKNSLVRYVRTDNGDEVSTRPMDDDDRQVVAEVDGQPLAPPKGGKGRKRRGELTAVPD